MVFEHGSALPGRPAEVKTEAGKQRRQMQCRERPAPPDDQIRKDRFRSGPGGRASQRIGYIRVSTPAQITDRQSLQLNDACDEVHVEHVSAIAAERPVFEAVIAALRPGDTLVVVDLDRAFRSAIDAIMTAQMLRERGVRFRVLSFPIDTASEEGELFYNILASFAQFERRIISRRTREGLDAARKRGARLGRPAALTADTIRQAHDWISETGLPCAYVSALLGVSRLTLQRGFRRLGLVYPLSQ